MNLNIFSDLRKPGLVPGESLSLSTKIDSVLDKNQSYTVNGLFSMLGKKFKSHRNKTTFILAILQT